MWSELILGLLLVSSEPPEGGVLETSRSDAWTTSTDSFWWGVVVVLLWALSKEAPHLISKAEIGHPMEEAHFNHLDLANFVILVSR